MPGKNLTRDEAAERRATITTHAYRVALDVTGGPDTFLSLTEIDFSATEGAFTFLDLVAEEVLAIELNGKALPLDSYADSRIELAHLQAENTVRVEALMAYSHTGEGLHRYVDPEDGEAYLYSQFEVADTRRAFACFEQPNLKARFSFTVDAPASWRVFSNSPVQSTHEAGNARRWVFEETPPLPCYVTAIVAGPYEGTDANSYMSMDGRRIPLGVWARKSLARYVDTEEIVHITRQGFGFYEKNYGCVYPFAKYDQVFCPQFNAGAMENAGLVTITESYLFRDKPSGFWIDRRAITILHELAHMWFGDLVTMQWWDDLWLNESFAEYMSHLAADEASDWTNAWTTFFASEKVRAIAQDQLPSTHPVAADIRTLEDVLVNFDQITYGKGASALKQLVAWVGQDAFLAGVRRYIALHRLGNATLGDLLAELETASGRDLSQWAHLWLESPGVNTLRPHVVMEGDRIGTLSIIQECGRKAPLRPHHIHVIGFGRSASGALVRSMSASVEINGESVDVPEFAGKARPELILVNGQDYSYAKTGLDSVSLATVLESAPQISDRLARTQAVFAAWDMCRDGLLPASRYIELALDVLGVEDDGTVLRTLITTVITAANLYSAPEHRSTVRAHAAERCFTAVAEAEPGSDYQLQMAGLAADLAETGEQFSRVRGWLDGTDVPPGYAVDASQRWMILAALAASGQATQSDIDAEYERDATSYGQVGAARARGALLDEAERGDIWEEICAGSTSNSRHRGLCVGTNRARAEAVAPYAQAWFERAREQWDSHTVEIATNMLSLAFPRQLVGREEEFGIDVIALGHAWLDANADAAPACIRLVSEGIDGAERMKRAQACDREARASAGAEH